jgi:hypothetical protein
VDHGNDAVDVLKHFVVPEAQHQPAAGSQVSIARGVLFGFVVLPAVHLDSDP